MGIARRKNLLRAETRPYSRYLYMSFMILFAAQGVATYYYVRNAQFVRFTKQRIVLQVGSAIPEVGHAYVFPLGTEWMDQSKLGSSPAVVFEDDTPLAGANSMHQEIREKGGGRYSVWRGSLYLSTSDNSDPRTNGRVYSIVWPRPITTPWKQVSYILGVAGAAGFLLRRLVLT